MKKAINVRNLGVNVKRYREEKGMTVGKLAEVLQCQPEELLKL